MRVSAYPSWDPFTFCQIMMVGGRGLWLDELRLSGAEQPSSSQGQHSWTQGCSYRPWGLYIVQAPKHRVLRIQEAVQRLPSVAVVTEVEFVPEHKMEGRSVRSINHMTMWML